MLADGTLLRRGGQPKLLGHLGRNPHEDRFALASPLRPPLLPSRRHTANLVSGCGRRWEGAPNAVPVPLVHLVIAPPALAASRAVHSATRAAPHVFPAPRLPSSACCREGRRRPVRGPASRAPRSPRHRAWRTALPDDRPRRKPTPQSAGPGWRAAGGPSKIARRSALQFSGSAAARRGPGGPALSSAPTASDNRRRVLHESKQVRRHAAAHADSCRQPERRRWQDHGHG